MHQHKSGQLPHESICHRRAEVFSGISTRSGDLLSVLIKSMGAGNLQAQKLHISMVAEVILELKESGTVLLE